MSLNFQLHFELRPRFATVWRRGGFFNCRLLLCVLGRVPTQRDLSRVLHSLPQGCPTQNSSPAPKGTVSSQDIPA